MISYQGRKEEEDEDDDDSDEIEEEEQSAIAYDWISRHVRNDRSWIEKEKTTEYWRNTTTHI